MTASTLAVEVIGLDITPIRIMLGLFSLLMPQFLFPAGMLGYATLRAKRVEDGPRRPRSPRRSPRSEAADPADSTDPGPISNG